MSRRLLVALALVAAPAPALAQAAAPAPAAAPIDSATVRSARTLLETMRAQDVFIATVERSLQSSEGAASQLPPNFVEKFLAAIRTESPKLIEDMALIYARHYTRQDMDEFNRFYRTPLGQRMIDKQAVITAESGTMGQRWGAALAMRVMGEMMQNGELELPSQ
jgi:hypothetical protein